MKKKVASFLLVVALLLQIIPVVGMAYPTPYLGAQNGTAKFAAGTPMSVSHRAAWRNGPENSLLAIAASINMGIDVAELDVKVTTDGVAVLMHDGSISRTTVGSGNVESMTWDELKTYAVESGQGSSNNPYILTEADVALLKSLPNYVEHCGEPEVGGTMPTARLDDAIDLIKMLGPNTMINWDHCTTQTRFVNSYILFRETGMLGNVFFKNSNSASTQNSWYSAAADAWNAKHPESPISAADVNSSVLYVYIIHSADYSPLQAHLDNGTNLVMTEICIGDDAADAAIQEKLEPWCKEKGVAMFVNTMWHGLCSTKNDTETTWVEMLDRGYTAIQTDQASELAYFLYDYNRTRASSEKIEAEHFNLFNYDAYGFTVAESCDSSLNKKVNGMVSGDWVSYKMSFTGTEAVMNLTMQGLDDSAEVCIYLDAMTEENLIATVNPGVTADYQTVSAEITGTITEGVHTLYIQVMGLPGKTLVSMDRFSFVSAASFEGEKTIAPISVTTEPGVAPVLPGTVDVTVGQTTYGLTVRWEQIDPESYAEAGTFTVLGYIPVLKTYITATVTVATLVPGIAQEHLALWLDASEGVTASDGAVTAWASKVGGITATVESGSPALVANAIGGQQGIYFDGSDIMTLTLPDNFWNKTDAEYTVLMFTSSGQTSSGNGTTVSGPSTNGSQRYSVMWFNEVADWGAVYFTASQNEVMWRFGSGTDGDRGLTAVRPIPVGTAYTSTVIRKDGSENTVFTDGAKIYTGTSASPNTKNTGSVGQIGWGQYGNYVGTICQILIYDTALTDEQIIAAHRWMGQKYADAVSSVETVAATCEAGNAPELPTSVKVTYASGAEATLGVTWESINPNDYLNAGEFVVKGTLANGMAVTATVTVTAKAEVVFPEDNVLLWFSSQNGLTADTDGKVSAWVDKETGTVTAAQATADNQPTVVYGTDGSVDGVRFDGNDLMNFNAGKDTFNGYEGMTMVVYSKPEGKAPTEIKKNHNNSVIYFGEYGDWSGMYLGTYTNGVTGRFGTATSDYRGILYTGGSYSDYCTTVLRKNGGTNDELIINGQVISSLTSTGTASGKTTKYIDGETGVLGKGKDSSAYWTGTVSEILIFNKALSDEELETVYAYLDETYAEKVEVSTNGLMFWLDASQGITTDANGTIQTWVPKVGSANAVWKKGDPSVIADAINGNPGVEFDGNADVMMMTLGSDAFNGLEGMTVIAYAKSNTSLNTSDVNWYCQRNTLFAVDETSAGWGAVYVGLYTNAISARFGTGVSQDRGFAGQRGESMTDFSTTTIRWDGAAKAYDVDVNGADFGTGASEGSATGHNKNVVYLGTGKENTYWNGTLCELLVYDRTLSDAEVKAVYAYLDEKYDPVVPDTIPVTGIYLKEAGSQQNMYPGDTLQLTASVVPADADNKGLVWDSSNSTVASVDENGLVTAHKTGYAVITVATAEGGYDAYCIIRVKTPAANTLWQDIQNLRDWAATQNPEHYNNWNIMADALKATESVTESASLEELTAAYETLRNAMLALELHSHELTEVPAKDPSCTETGNSAYYTCTCGRWYLDAEAQYEILDKESVVIPTVSHTWTNATCTAPKTCNVCGETEGEALDHDWTDATCTASKTCAVCGETEGEALDHDWTDATCTAPKTCAVCGETEGEALDHSSDSWLSDSDKHWKLCACGEKFDDADHVDTDKDGDCDICDHDVPVLDPSTPSTGDSSHIVLMLTLMVLSIAAIAVLVSFKLKKRTAK